MMQIPTHQPDVLARWLEDGIGKPILLLLCVPDECARMDTWRPGSCFRNRRRPYPDHSNGRREVGASGRHCQNGYNPILFSSYVMVERVA